MTYDKKHYMSICVSKFSLRSVQSNPQLQIKFKILESKKYLMVRFPLYVSEFLMCNPSGDDMLQCF